MSSPHPKAVEALFRVLIGSPGVSLPYLRFVMLRLAGFNITPRAARTGHHRLPACNIATTELQETEGLVPDLPQTPGLDRVGQSPRGRGSRVAATSSTHLSSTSSASSNCSSVMTSGARKRRQLPATPAERTSTPRSAASFSISPTSPLAGSWYSYP